MSIFHIRFNTQHNGSPFVWRIFEDGVEHLASNFHINVPMTSGITHEHGDTKWNVQCEGKLHWNGTVAIIDDN